jgi:hypothetical protein
VRGRKKYSALLIAEGIDHLVRISVAALHLVTSTGSLQ